MASMFISVREAAKKLKEAGVSYTRPTLKNTLYAAMEKNKEEYSGLIIQTGDKSWIKINLDLLQKWTEDTFHVKLKEIKKEEKK